MRPTLIRWSDPTLAIVSLVLFVASIAGVLDRLHLDYDVAISIAAALLALGSAVRWAWEHRHELTIDNLIALLSATMAAAIDERDELAARRNDLHTRIAQVRSALAGVQLSPSELSGILDALGPDPDADTVRVRSGEIDSTPPAG